MTMYAGLDVSDKTTHICVVTGKGAVFRRNAVASDPDVAARGPKFLSPGCASQRKSAFPSHLPLQFPAID